MKNASVRGSLLCLVLIGLAAPTMAANRLPATVADKASCLTAVADAKAAASDAQVTETIRAQINDLIRVSDHLCTQGNFVYAETTLQIARGMAAQE